MNRAEDKREIITCVILTIAYCLWIIFIFSNSIQNGDVSSRWSEEILTYLQQFIPGITEYFVRKAAHFTEFAILEMIGNSSLKIWKKLRLPKKRIPFISSMYLPAGISAFMGLIIGLTDETLQLFIEGRNSQVVDVWIDFAGCCTGIALIIMIDCRIHKLHGT